jgi:hypothetical protein
LFAILAYQLIEPCHIKVHDLMQMQMQSMHNSIKTIDATMSSVSTACMPQKVLYESRLHVQYMHSQRQYAQNNDSNPMLD